jgi:hypothetical protein
MMNYYTTADPFGSTVIIRIDGDGSQWSFTEIPENTDYQRYLAWVAEGNTATEWQPEA